MPSDTAHDAVDGGEALDPLRAENAALRAQVVALEHKQQLLMSIIDNSPNMIFAKDPEGRYLLMNPVAARVARRSPAEVVGMTDDELFPDQAASMRFKDLEIMRDGTPVQYEETLRSAEETYHLLTIKFPIYHAHGEAAGVAAVVTDITARKREEAATLALQQQVIQAQQAALRELSTPLVPIADGVLAMPIVGVIDSLRAGQIMETLLDGISKQGARTAILDVTGVRIVDEPVADALVRAARAARLLGARVLLTGISPDVAKTLVQLSANLENIVTLSTLQSGIAYAIGQGARL